MHTNNCSVFGVKKIFFENHFIFLWHFLRISKKLYDSSIVLLSFDCRVVHTIIYKFIPTADDDCKYSIRYL